MCTMFFGSRRGMVHSGMLNSDPTTETLTIGGIGGVFGNRGNLVLRCDGGFRLCFRRLLSGAFTHSYTCTLIHALMHTHNPSTVNSPPINP